MARFVVAVVLMAVVVGLAFGFATAVRRVAGVGRDRLMQLDKEHGTMQRISGVLLLALIVYVSLWGGA
ncbi:MAG: hypothetical protein GW905_06520 [Rhodobacterales bacterium]|nr:hypothetical protein [Rhodobacterales bacterium]